MGQFLGKTGEGPTSCTWKAQRVYNLVMLGKEIGTEKQVQLWHLVSGKLRAAWTSACPHLSCNMRPQDNVWPDHADIRQLRSVCRRLLERRQARP